MGSTVDDLRCVECGCQASELYRPFQGGVIKIAQCGACENVVDKYIEYDPIIILLDAILHKPQAYRHILFNTKLKWSWKLLLILLVCDAYQKWEQLHFNNDLDSTTNTTVIFNAAVELDFYAMFLKAAIEWLILCVTLISLLSVGIKYQLLAAQQLSASGILISLILSSYGKLLVIPASIWGQSHVAIYRIVTQVFIFTSNSCALKVQCSSGRFETILILAVAYFCQYLLGQWLSWQHILHLSKTHLCIG